MEMVLPLVMNAKMVIYYFRCPSCLFVVVLVGATGIGLGAGILWFLVWQCAGIVTLSLMLTAANTGFLIMSIAMYSPLGK